MNTRFQKARNIGSKLLTASALTVVGMGTAAAQAIDSAAVITEINGHKTTALAVAGAMILAVLALKAVKLVRRA